MKWAIDVSEYDAREWTGSTWNYDLPMDWVMAREVGGLDLAIIKSSEGINFKDPGFDLNWQAARGVLPRAAYHFFRSNQDAIQQAASCWGYLQAAGFDAQDYVILDYETLDGIDPVTSLKFAGSWLYEMEKHNVLPLIYTYPVFWKYIGGESAAWAARYPLALAQWIRDIWVLGFPINIFDAPKLAALKADVASGALQPDPLKPWTKPAIWQFTARADTKAVPGHPAVKKVADFDAVLMDIAGGGGGGGGGGGQPPVYALYKTLNSINVRQGASQTSAWLGVVMAGTVLTVDDETVQNGYIHFINNIYGPASGWVWAAYTQKI